MTAGGAAVAAAAAATLLAVGAAGGADTVPPVEGEEHVAQVVQDCNIFAFDAFGPVAGEVPEYDVL